MSAITDLLGLGGDSYEMPVVDAGQPKRTAEPVSDLDRRKKRLAASLLTRDWATPKLGAGGLLGVTG